MTPSPQYGYNVGSVGIETPFLQTLSYLQGSYGTNLTDDVKFDVPSGNASFYFGSNSAPMSIAILGAKVTSGVTSGIRGKFTLEIPTTQQSILTASEQSVSDQVSKASTAVLFQNVNLPVGIVDPEIVTLYANLNRQIDDINNAYRSALVQSASGDSTYLGVVMGNFVNGTYNVLKILNDALIRKGYPIESLSKSNDDVKIPVDVVGELTSYMDKVRTSNVLTLDEKRNELQRVQEILDDYQRNPNNRDYDFNTLNFLDLTIHQQTPNEKQSYFVITPERSATIDGVTIPKKRNVQTLDLLDAQVDQLIGLGYDVVPTNATNAQQILDKVEQNNKYAEALLNGQRYNINLNENVGIGDFERDQIDQINDNYNNGNINLNENVGIGNQRSSGGGLLLLAGLLSLGS